MGGMLAPVVPAFGTLSSHCDEKENGRHSAAVRQCSWLFSCCLSHFCAFESSSWGWDFFAKNPKIKLPEGERSRFHICVISAVNNAI